MRFYISSFFVFLFLFSVLIVSLSFVFSSRSFVSASSISEARIQGFSMLPGFTPDSVLVTRVLGSDERLLAGHVYIYDGLSDGNVSLKVFHRLVYESVDGFFYFKGDNNDYLDGPYTRDKVKFEVVGVKW